MDAGWLQDVVLNFCKESGPSFLASKGFGAGGARKMIRQTGSKVLSVGEGFEYVRLVEGDCILEINADQWKSWLHARLRTPIGQAGALTLFHSSDHTSFGKHLIAEHEVEEFVKGKGVVTRFESVSRVNHWLDSTAMACVGGHIAGQRLVTTTPPPSPPAPGQTQRRRLSNPWLGDLQAEWRRSGMTGREAERDER